MKNIKIFDEDLLGLKSLHVTPEYTAKKSKRAAWTFWRHTFPLLLAIIVAAAGFFLADLVAPVTDEIAPVVGGLLGKDQLPVDQGVVYCDWCGLEENGHVCLYSGKCEQTDGKCVDMNKDHKCDRCDQALGGECRDYNYDHKCDYCRVVLTECKDANSNFSCDVCGNTAYSKLQGALLLDLVFIVGFILAMINWIIRLIRFGMIRVEFYNDLIVYKDGAKDYYRAFHGVHSILLTPGRPSEFKKPIDVTNLESTDPKVKGVKRATVTLCCPGGPAMSMTFNNMRDIANFHSYLKTKKAAENVSYSTSQKAGENNDPALPIETGSMRIQ